MKKILHIEDKEILRRQLARRLNQWGYEVIQAENGQEGVSKAQIELPDLILMDLGLPIMDGYEASRCIKDDPNTSSIPIIALTGHTVNREKVQNAGCDELLSKPVRVNALRSKIDFLLKEEGDQ